jgi:hypothetical protein
MRFFIVLLTLISISCGGIQQTISAPGDVDAEPDPAHGPQYQVWADGRLEWDEASNNLLFIPKRAIEGHYDVWPLLNPPNCDDCVTINVTDHDPVAKLITADVTLKNPTNLTGWFVRGLVIPHQTTELEVITPHGWWHPADFAWDYPAAPYMIFAVAELNYKFGPGETHTATYQFHYGKLSDFSLCEYRVIVRWPKNPGEVRGMKYPEIHGGFTTLGGFISFSIGMEKDDTAPEVTMYAYKIINGVADNPVTMMLKTPGRYLTWFQGEETSDDTATIWVSAQMEGCQDYLARRIDVPIQDVTPTPSRTFPPLHDGVSVFVDQLVNYMTPQQTEFIATNCVGSQKLVKSLADSVRAYNPDFIVLQYHLAFGEGDISNIYGEDWIKNWEFVNAQEDFFEHRIWSTQPNNRVLQVDWNWYLTDPTSDWVLYFIGNTIERMDPIGDQFDAVFADSASQPWNTDPEKWWEGSDDPHDMFTYWTPKTQYFFDTVALAYHTLPTYYYLIPNAGSYVTTISDITYHQCDGVMIEGFCHWDPWSYFTEVDWCLQMNRTRDLAIEDKIILCQTDVEVDLTLDRSFVLGSYMLLQDNYTYLNMMGPWGLDPTWWPEYYWNPGPATEDWTTIDELEDPGGCYARHFENGIVIVNPSDETRYYTTTKTYSHTMFAGGGLLPEDGVPTGEVTGPLEDPGPKEIPPHSAYLGIG